MQMAIAILFVVLNVAILAAAVWFAFKIIKRVPRIGPKGALVMSPHGAEPKFPSMPAPEASGIE